MGREDGCDRGVTRLLFTFCSALLLAGSCADAQVVSKQFIISDNFKREQVIEELSSCHSFTGPSLLYEINSISYITNNIPVTYRPILGHLASCGQMLPFQDERSYFCVTDTTGHLMTTPIYAAVAGQTFDLVITIKEQGTTWNVTLNAKVLIMTRCFKSNGAFNGIETANCLPVSLPLQFLEATPDFAKFQLPTDSTHPLVLSEIVIDGSKLFTANGSQVHMQVLGTFANETRMDVLSESDFLTSTSTITNSLNAIVRLGNVQILVKLKLRGALGNLQLSQGDVILSSFRGNLFCTRDTCLEKIKDWKLAFAKETGCVDTTEKTNLLSYFDLCAGPPQVRVNSHSPLTVNLRDPVSLKCEYVSLRPPTVRWFTERYGQTTQMSTGPDLDVASVSLQHQASYYCTVWNRITTRRSNSIVLRVNDSIVIKLTMKIKNKIFTSELLDPSSSAFTTQDNTIRNSVDGLIFKLLTNRERGFNVTAFQESAGGFFADSVLELQLQPGETSPELTQEVFGLLQPSFAAETLGDLRVTNVTFAGSDACFPESTALATGLVLLQWPTSPVDRTAVISCQTSATEQARRFCRLNLQTRVAEWEAFDNTQCNISVSDPVSVGLASIQQQNITRETADRVSESLEHITSNSSLLTPENVKTSLVILEKILDTGSTDDEVQRDSVQIISNILGAKSTLDVASQVEVNFASRLLGMLDLLGQLSAFNESSEFVFTTDNVALAAFEASKPEPMGYSVTFDPTDGIQIMRGHNDTLSTPKAFFFMPPDLFMSASANSPMQVFTLYFPNVSLFIPASDPTQSVSPVFATAVFIDNTEVHTLKTPVEYSVVKDDNATTQDRSCVWYNKETFKWTGSGCSLVNTSASGMLVCQCNHLTHFGVLFGSDSSSLNELDQQILTVITYVGCGVSLACAFLTFVTFLVFPHLRTTRPPKILMNLCAALICMIIFFVAGVESTGNQTSCRVMAALLQYFFLCVFSWSFIEAVISFRGIVRPMSVQISREMLYCFLFGWGSPIVFTAVGAGIWWEEYSDGTSCVVRNAPFYITVLPFIVVVLVFNIFALVMIICAVKQSSDRYSNSALNFNVRCRIVFAFVVLFGLTWTFGLLTIDNNNVALQYIFCILNSFHGLYIFLFYCARNEAVRLAWKERAFFDSARRRSSSIPSSSTRRRSRKQTQSTLQITPQQQQEFAAQVERNERRRVSYL